MADKRHEERALLALEQIYLVTPHKGSDDRIAEQKEIIAAALAATEAELVARMMEPSEAMIDACDSKATGRIENWRAMLTAFARENSIPLPEETETGGKDG